MDPSIRSRFLVAVAAVTLTQACGRPLDAQVTIKDIVENLRRNEALYDNIDVVVRYDYSIGNRSGVEFTDGGVEVVSESTCTHFVQQGEKFRLERTGTAVHTGSVVSRDRIRAFDGEITRLYDQNAIGNIIDRRSADARQFRPYSVLLTPLQQSRLLSVYLASRIDGGRASSSALRGAVITARYIGQGEHKGLLCHRVQISSENGGEPRSTREILLAEDRNYFPVHMKSYDFRISNETPDAEGEVSEMREISPGVWYPIDITYTCYDHFLSKGRLERTLRWRKRYVVDQVSLSPDYAMAYFRDVTFPDGTAIYEIVDGKQKRSYVKGSPQSTSRDIGSFPRLLVLVNVLIVAAAAAAALALHRKPRLDAIGIDAKR